MNEKTSNSLIEKIGLVIGILIILAGLVLIIIYISIQNQDLCTNHENEDTILNLFFCNEHHNIIPELKINWSEWDANNSRVILVEE